MSDSKTSTAAIKAIKDKTKATSIINNTREEIFTVEEVEDLVVLLITHLPSY